MRLYLVRHGETAYNRDGLGLGVADASLTELGLRQTAAAVERLAGERVDRILTSPLTRASSIARDLAERTGAPLEVRDELIEMDVGETEGLPFAEMRERFPGFLEAWRAPDPSQVAMPGGESLAQVAAPPGPPGRPPPGAAGPAEDAPPASTRSLLSSTRFPTRAPS